MPARKPNLSVAKEFTPEDVHRRSVLLMSVILWGILAILGATVAATIKEDGLRITVVFVAAAVMWIPFTLHQTRIFDLTLGIARALGYMSDRAKELQVGSDLFDRFCPSQEVVDRELTVLAMSLDYKCRNQASFYTEHRAVLADVLPLINLDNLKLQKLANREQVLKSEVAQAKEQFWALHGRLKARNFIVHDRWTDYLPQKEESHPDFEPVEGRNEPPGQ